MRSEFDKALAELPILRDFIDFVNAQVGVYMDCLAGFRGNTVRIERQIARVQHPVGRRIENGVPVMMYASIEDPSSPQVIHHRIIRAQDFLAANAELGFNEQQASWSIIVFLFAHWDELVRPQIAAVRETELKNVRLDALGDLRLIRNAIVHNKGVLLATDHAKLKNLGNIVKPGEKVALSHDAMHALFAAVKKGIGELVLTYTGGLPGAPDPSEIKEVAIANVGPSTKNGPR